MTLIAVTLCPVQPHYTELVPPRPPAQKQQEPSRGTERVLVMETTAYCYTGRQTKTGTWPEVGRTVAVDPEVIPLGTRVYIEGHGWRVAEDVGGAIRGNRLDLYMGSKQEALEWGRREVKVVVE